MIARLLRGLWCVTIVVTIAAVWFSVHRFGPTVGPWVAGLGAVMVVGALHPLGIAGYFAASRLYGDPVPPAHRLSLWGMVGTYDAEIDASLRGVWFATPFLGARPAPVPAEVTRRHALLFVHGYFCNRAVWLSFMRDAAARGYRCEAITLADPFATIDGHDEQMAAAVAALAPAPDDRVILVCHSMGGLVARAAWQRMDASRIAHVFTLGTPHRGTHLARFGQGASVRQMRRGGPWLAALEAREATGSAGVPASAWTTIWSRHDNVVYPQSTGCLDGAECVAIDGCGHVSLLYDAPVRAIVFARLEALEAAQALPAS